MGNTELIKAAAKEKGIDTNQSVQRILEKLLDVTDMNKLAELGVSVATGLANAAKDLIKNMHSDFSGLQVGERGPAIAVINVADPDWENYSGAKPSEATVEHKLVDGLKKEIVRVRVRCQAYHGATYSGSKLVAPGRYIPQVVFDVADRYQFNDTGLKLKLAVDKPVNVAAASQPVVAEVSATLSVTSEQRILSNPVNTFEQAFRFTVNALTGIKVVRL